MIARLFLLVGFAFAQDLDVEEYCSEDGTLEECVGGECVSVDAIEFEATPSVAKKPVAKREATPAPTCPKVETIGLPPETTTRPFGDVRILGALDKSNIDAVIKRNMSQVRYCYQRELVKNPKLGGKMAVKFVIAKDGTVSSTSMRCSDLDNAAVEDCIEGRFQKFQFPEPKGGGIVITTYPLTFSPG